ncbi:hypothetical protein HY638_05835 [Candidatus Woesearchaeota archaeon]|nr:hypothetical protein [Candidatus Woesearchaeota archaeon]
MRKIIEKEESAVEKELKQKEGKLIEEISSSIISGLGKIREFIESSGFNPSETSRSLVELHGDAVSRIYDHVASKSSGENKLALLFVGSYERGDPSLASDVDLRFVSEKKPSDLEGAVISEFKCIHMDIYERVKESFFHGRVETASVLNNTFDMSDLKDPTQINSYLGVRFLKGDPLVLENFRKNFYEKLDKLIAVKNLFDRFDSVSVSYNKEAVNLKDSIGGFRDDNLLRWLYLVYSGGGNEPHISNLTMRGILSDEEKERYASALEILKGVRHLIHCGFSRNEFDENRFIESVNRERASYIAKFPYLVAIQRFLRRKGIEVPADSSEVVMKAVFQATMDVQDISRSVVNHYYEKEPIMKGGFEIKKNRVYMGYVPLDALQVMKAFSLASNYGLNISSSLRRSLIGKAQYFDVPYDDCVAVSSEFKRVFEGKEVHSAMKMLADTGLLFAYLPQTRLGFEYSNERGKRKLPHSKTVLKQSLEGIAKLEEISRVNTKEYKPSKSYKEFKRVYDGLGKKVVEVYLGLLFHDIGVGFDTNWAEHQARGRDIFLELAYANRFPESGVDVVLVAWLMENHNKLYQRATLGITGDFDSLNQLAKEIGSMERLDMLYLYTVADTLVKFEGPRALLETNQVTSLYNNLKALLDKMETNPITSAESFVEEKITKLKRFFYGDDKVISFLGSLPFDFVLGIDPDDTRHIRNDYTRIISGEHIAVIPGEYKDMHGEVIPGYHELRIIANDEVGLLSKVAGLLYAAGFNIVSSDIHTLKLGGKKELDHNNESENKKEGEERSRVYDRLLIQGPYDSAFTQNLIMLLNDKGENPLSRFLSEYQEETLYKMKFPGEIKVEDDSICTRILFDVRKDERGQLAAITRYLSEKGYNINSLKSTVWGEGNLNMFYVTRDGKKIPPIAFGALTKELTHRFIDAGHS